MKIVIPTADGKLCAHFGHCETFSFAEVDLDKKEILSITTNAPLEGVSCQSAGWIAEQGADLVLAGGMGGRPMMMFQQCGVPVIAGCPELEIETIVRQYLDNTLTTGDNSCGHGEGHSCHGHGEGHSCHGHGEDHHCHGHH